MSYTYYAIDFETANDYPNSACSVGVVRFVDGIEQNSVYSLIKPAKMYFKPEFTEIHHLSYNNVRNQPQFPEVWQTVIEPFIKNKDGSETIFIAHNAKFDMGVLRACFNYFGMPVPSIEYKCTLNISRRVWKDLKWHKLTYLAEQFEIEYDAHNALEDARTCGKIYALSAEKLGCNLDEVYLRLGLQKTLLNVRE